MIITKSQAEPTPLNILSEGIVRVTEPGMPSKSITFFPMDKPISQISPANISRNPNKNVLSNRNTGDSVSKPKPANIAFIH